VVANVSKNPATNLDVSVTLSTTNNGETDKDFTGFAYIQGASASAAVIAGMYKRKVLVIAAETLYYMNVMVSTSSASSIGLSNTSCPLFIRAICPYL
jgi:hypothetical protein